MLNVNELTRLAKSSRNWTMIGSALLVLAGCGARVLEPVDGPTATRVQAGFDFSCAIDVDASVVCWGRNTRGELGNGDDSSRISPVQIALDDRFVSLSTRPNARHACAVTWRREAYCWGQNSFGQLGIGSSVDQSTPARVDTDREFRVVSAGWRFTCALTTDDDAYCWGRGEWGQLGDGLAERSMVPVKVAGGHKFRTIEVGSNNLVCGLTRNGQVLCWGLDYFGSLGAPAPDTCTRVDGLVLACAKVPQSIDSQQSFVHVSTGNSFACAIDSVGSSWCWGVNGSGQLGSAPLTLCVSFDGLSQFPCSIEPTLVDGGLDFVSISAGALHACGITRTGAGYCWGSNSIGQRGDGTLGVATAAPTEIIGGLEFLTVSAGANHSCGETLGRNLWCWGLNDVGQLGTANNNLELVPALVSKDR